MKMPGQETQERSFFSEMVRAPLVPQHIIREYEDSNLGHKFATPQRICAWFPLAEVSDNDTIE